LAGRNAGKCGNTASCTCHAGEMGERGGRLGEAPQLSVVVGDERVPGAARSAKVARRHAGLAQLRVRAAAHTVNERRWRHVRAA